MSQHVLLTNFSGATSVQAVATGLNKTLSFTPPTLKIHADVGMTVDNPAWPTEGVRFWVTFENFGSDTPHHDCDVVWSFDDIGTFAAASEIPALVNLGRNNRNIAVGWATVHAWATEGERTVTATAYRNGAVVTTATQRIYVSEAEFTSANSVLVVPAGTDITGAPAHSAVYNDFAFKSFPAKGRIWMKKGTEFDVSLLAMSATMNGPRNWLFRTWGNEIDGPVRFVNPTTQEIAVFSLNMKNEPQWSRHVFSDIKLDSTYDPTIISGGHANGGGSNSNYVKTSFFKSEVRGAGIGLGNSASYSPATWRNEDRELMVVDCKIHEHRKYLSYNGSGKASVRGSVFKAHDLADAGGPPWDTHGCLRLSESSGLIWQQNYSFVCSGWSGGNPNKLIDWPSLQNATPVRTDGKVGVQAHQPTLRSNVSGMWGPYSVVTGNVIEGAAWANGGSSGSRPAPADAIFDYNYCISTPSTGRPIYVSMGPWSGRRNIFLVPYAMREQDVNQDLVGCGGAAGDGYEQDMAFLHFYQNTIIHLLHPTDNKSSVTSVVIKEPSTVATADDYVEDNVVLAPNVTGGTDVLANFDIATVVGNPRYSGMRSKWNGIFQPAMFAIPAQDGAARNQMTAPKPLAAANAYRSMTRGKRTTSLDFHWRRVRPEIGLSQGAVDPDAVAL